MIEQIFELSDSVRYVAIYEDGTLSMRSKEGTAGASSGETDRYEELLVNPTLLTLATQRGEIDCGGLDFILVRYGNFFQLVQPTAGGHVSVCIEAEGAPLEIAGRVAALVAREA